MELRARVEAVRRLSWIAGAALLWGACILIRIIYLQVVAHDEYLRLARLQQIRTVEIPAPRGSIFDRTGQPLAMSVPMDSVFVNPQHVPDLEVGFGNPCQYSPSGWGAALWPDEMGAGA